MHNVSYFDIETPTHYTYIPSKYIIFIQWQDCEIVFTAWGTLCKVFTVYCTFYSADCRMCNVYSTMTTVHCIIGS